MDLTVLGACGTYPAARGACSGYLLRHDGFNLWIDAGTGTMATLQKHIPIDQIDAVFISHMHPDHFVDLYPLLYAFSFHPNGPLQVPVFAPNCGEEILGRLISDGPKDGFPKVFDWQTMSAGSTATIGPFDVKIFESAHSIENLGLRVECDRAVLAYSGDTGPTPHLRALAEGADLFVCEASWQDGETAIDAPIHLTAREAGAAATEAGAKRLVLTHIWPKYDLRRSRDQAAEAFDGPVDLAAKTGKWTL